MLIECIAYHSVDERSLSCCHFANKADFDQQIHVRIIIFKELNDGLVDDPAILIKGYLALRAIIRYDSTEFTYGVAAFGYNWSSLGLVVAELALPTIHP